MLETFSKRRIVSNMPGLLEFCGISWLLLLPQFPIEVGVASTLPSSS